MARMVFAQHGPDLFVQCEWRDGYGVHTRRATEDMETTIRARADQMIAANPDVVRWQLDRPGAVVLIGMMKDDDTGPRYDHTIKQAVATKASAAALMDWCDAYCVRWVRLNDEYEEEREIDREQDKVNQRRGDLERRQRGR